MGFRFLFLSFSMRAMGEQQHLESGHPGGTKLIPVWNHNLHYHAMLLKKMPVPCETALDIGSGTGLFASKLSQKAKRVAALEPDQSSAEQARRETAGNSNLSHIRSSFLEHDFQAARFDCISALASLHHMDFEPALRKMRSLLNPKGRILILGLYKEKSLLDYLISLPAIPANIVKNAVSEKVAVGEQSMITTEARMGLNEIRQSADALLPGCRVKRHLFWRYSIVWEKPEAEPIPPSLYEKPPAGSDRNRSQDRTGDSS